MLKSLFGELGPSRTPSVRQPVGMDRDDDHGFADTVSPEDDAMQQAAGDSAATDLARDEHLSMRGSAAQAIRDHFAISRADLDTAARQITIYDPAGAWAGAVIKALSDTAGGPIERLQLHDGATGSPLATIERTTLARRNEDTLKIYNVDVHAVGPGGAEIPITLMESSHLSVVIVGLMEPPAIEAMLTMLAAAARRPAWRCPDMLFLLPPGAVEIAARIGAQSWPAALRLQVQDESLTSASAAWNAVLGAWNQVKALPGWDADSGDAAPSAPIPSFSLGSPTADEPAVPFTAPSFVDTGPGFLASAPGELRGPDGTPAEPRPRRSFDTARALRSLDAVSAVDGLLGCALVHASSGLPVARAGDAHAFDAELAATAAAQVLRSHRMAAPGLGLDAPLDEIVVGAGSRLLVLRSVPHHPDLFLCALLDRQRASLPLARQALDEVEKALA